MAEDMSGADRYMLPQEKYSPEQLKEIYVPKGAEDGNSVASLPYQQIFLPLMDRILGGMTPRKCARWLQVTFGIYVKYTDIQKYVETYIPDAIKGSLHLASKEYQNARVDPIEIMEDQIRWQKERLSQAKAAPDNFPRFNFGKEMHLLHIMAKELLEKKQDLGLLPKVAAGQSNGVQSEDYVADHGDVELKRDLDALTPAQAARLIDAIDKLKVQLGGNNIIDVITEKDISEEPPKNEQVSR